MTNKVGLNAVDPSLFPARENKTGRNTQNFQIVIDHRRIETNFIFQAFRYEKSKILLHLIHFD